jgi:hypothetical protein
MMLTYTICNSIYLIILRISILSLLINIYRTQDNS